MQPKGEKAHWLFTDVARARGPDTRPKPVPKEDRLPVIVLQDSCQSIESVRAGKGTTVHHLRLLVRVSETLRCTRRRRGTNESHVARQALAVG